MHDYLCSKIEAAQACDQIKSFERIGSMKTPNRLLRIAAPLIALSALLTGIAAWLTISTIETMPVAQPIAGIELRFANSAVLLALDDDSCQSITDVEVRCARSLNGQRLEVKLQTQASPTTQWSLGFGAGTPRTCQALYVGKSAACTSAVPKADAAIFAAVTASDLGLDEALAASVLRQNLFVNLHEAEWSGLAALLSALLATALAIWVSGLLAQIERVWRVAAAAATFIVATVLSMSAWVALLLQLRLID